LRKIILFFLLTNFFLHPLFAHENDWSQTKEITEEVVDPSERSPLPPFKEAILNHLHNKLIHFPIAFSILAFLFLLLSFKYPEFKKTYQILLLLSALVTIPVYFTGEIQIQRFEGKANEWLAETHEEFGIFTIISIWLWLLISYIKPLKKFSIIFGIITMILISTTGYYAGILAHP